ncbi:MAG: hypothetical protein HYY00_08195 [Chloroflexi bacterium]|nr:hypothetical protein [Chloroflexota bacterium]
MAASSAQIGSSIAAIREDREHGASFLARKAVRTMVMAARSVPAGAGVEDYLRGLARELARARPTMVPIRNAVARFLEQMEATGCWDSEAAARVGREVEGLLEHAVVQAAARAAAMIRDGSRVLTCSYSSTVARALVEAHRSCKALSVLVLESGSGHTAHGRRLASELAKAGLDARVVADRDMGKVVKVADLALVGADRVLPGGDVVNGAPSLELALACRGASVPFYVVADSFKLDSEGAPQALEPGFQLVPARLIAAVITEEG